MRTKSVLRESGSLVNIGGACTSSALEDNKKVQLPRKLDKSLIIIDCGMCYIKCTNVVLSSCTNKTTNNAL